MFTFNQKKKKKTADKKLSSESQLIVTVTVCLDGEV